MAMTMPLPVRAEVIRALAIAYESLADSGAPPDTLSGVTYWLRVATREGLTDEDLEHVLEATVSGTVAPMVRPGEG